MSWRILSQVSQEDTVEVTYLLDERVQRQVVLPRAAARDDVLARIGEALVAQLRARPVVVEG